MEEEKKIDTLIAIESAISTFSTSFQDEKYHDTYGSISGQITSLFKTLCRKGFINSEP